MNLTPAELAKGRRLLEATHRRPATPGDWNDAVVEWEQWCAVHGEQMLDTLLADHDAIRREAVQQTSSDLLAKFRSKQAICEQANLGPEAAWWAEAQRLLGEVGDVEAALEEVKREAVTEFADKLADKFDASFPVLGLAIREEAADRGVNLDDKAANKQPQGEEER